MLRLRGRMSLVRVVLSECGSVRLEADGMPSLTFGRKWWRSDSSEVLRARLWDDVVQCRPISAAADEWFSKFLQIADARLVCIGGGYSRPISSKYAPNVRPPAKQTHEVSFADGFPFLLIGSASLTWLNEQLTDLQLPINRFRPNIVFDRCDPFEEDGWEIIRIGDVEFHLVKPCERCVITTTDQDTAKRDSRAEPLRTLGKTRYAKEVGDFKLFGQNLVHATEGSLKVGDDVEVIKFRQA